MTNGEQPKAPASQASSDRASRRENRERARQGEEQGNPQNDGKPGPSTRQARSMTHATDTGTDALIAAMLTDFESRMPELIEHHTRSYERQITEQRVRISVLESKTAAMARDVQRLRTDVNSLLEDLQIPEIAGENSITTRDVLARISTRLESLESRVYEGNLDIDASKAMHDTPNGDLDAPTERIEPPSEDKKDTGTGEKDPKEGKKHRKSRKKKKTRKSSKRKHREDDDSDPSSSSDGSVSDDSDTDDSASETEDSESSDSEDSDTREEREARYKERIDDGTRQMGKRHEGLRVLRPTNSLFDRVMNYRFYRLAKRHKRRTGRETRKVRDHIRAIQTGAPELRFDGKDPVAILGFLYAFVAECETNYMKESQALVAVKYFLHGQVRTQFDAARKIRSKDGGVAYWPEAVQYLLRTYATNDALSSALLDLRDTRQKPQESETDYSARLLDAEYRCGNVHDAEERMTLFIDGLNPGIRSLVARHREAERRYNRRKRDKLTYLDLVQYAQNEGDACRARMTPRNGEPTTRKQVGFARYSTANGNTSGARRVMTMESPPDSRETRQGRSGYEDALNLLQEGNTSLPTNYLPTSSEVPTSDRESLMLAQEKRVPAPHIPHQDARTRQSRPGWAGYARGTARSDTPPGRIICHTCYVPNHTVRTCTISVSVEEAGRIARNFENLSQEDKARIPADNYWRAKALLEVIETRANALREADTSNEDKYADDGGQPETPSAAKN